MCQNICLVLCLVPVTVRDPLSDDTLSVVQYVHIYIYCIYICCIIFVHYVMFFFYFLFSFFFFEQNVARPSCGVLVSRENSVEGACVATKAPRYLSNQRQHVEVSPLNYKVYALELTPEPDGISIYQY